MSNKINKRVPEIRFSEFEGNWTLNKLRNISSLSSGATPLRSNSSYFENATIPWVKTTDLNNSEIIKTEECISEIAIKETSARKNPVGSVLIAMYGGFNQIGRTGLLKIEAATNQAITVVFPKPVIDSFFLQHFLNRNVDEWRTFAASSRKDPNITSKDIGDFLIVFPLIEEQEKIASFLGSIDTRLTQIRRKHELLQTYKRGVMQKIFSQELRFKDAIGSDFPDWEEKKLGDICSLIKDGTHGTHQGVRVTV
jgi:type I restriction enzyme, S subunit